MAAWKALGVSVAALALALLGALAVSVAGEGGAAPDPGPAGTDEEPLPVKEVRDELAALSRVLFERDDLSVARAVGVNAYRLGARDPGLLHLIAYCASAAGRDEEALEWYDKARRAIQRQPAGHQELLKKCLNNQGAILARLGRARKAERLYRQALEADPACAQAHFNLGLLLAEDPGRPDEAIEAFRSHIVHGGGRGVAARNLIRRLQEQGGAGGD
jgi:tetratricopeptide (TPR) repeat protein